MIKKDTTTTGEKVVVTYVCDNCVKEMPGLTIMVYYPYGHINDSLDGPSHLCSDKCLIEFNTKLMKKYGAWKSEKIEKKTPSSVEGRAKPRVVRPKARRAVRRVKRKRIQRKPKAPDFSEGC